jgi:hypothetical protein
MQTVVRDPIEAAEDAKQRYSEGECGWLAEKYEILAVVYALGQYLKYNGTAWRAFINHEFFAYRKNPLRPIKDQPKAMRHAMYFVLSATNEPKRDRAATYARGLAVLVRQGIRADDVAAEIRKAGGIEALVEAAKTDPTRPQGYKPPDDPDYYNVSGEEHEEEEEQQEQKQAVRAATKTSRSDSAAYQNTAKVHTQERGYDPRGRRTVEIEVTEEQWKEFMALQPGEKVVVRIEKQDRDGEWERLKTRHMFQWPSARSRQLLRH